MFFCSFFGAMMCFALDNRWRERVHAQAYLYSYICRSRHTSLSILHYLSRRSGRKVVTLRFSPAFSVFGEVFFTRSDEISMFVPLLGGIVSFQFSLHEIVA